MLLSKTVLSGVGKPDLRRERLGNPGGLITRRAVFIIA